MFKDAQPLTDWIVPQSEKEVAEIMDLIKDDLAAAEASTEQADHAYDQEDA